MSLKDLKYICFQFSGHEARIWVQVVFLGSNPRKYCERAVEGKESRKVH